MTTSLYIGQYPLVPSSGTPPTTNEPELCVQNLSERVINYISLEGSIASGKSTFLKYVRLFIKEHRLDATEESHIDRERLEKDYYLIIDEPVDEWSEPIHQVGDEMLSMLEIFYRDPATMGFSFQCYAFTTRLRRLIQTLAKIVPTDFPRRVHILSERSLRGDKLFLGAVSDTSPDSSTIKYQLFIYNQFHDTICRGLNRHHNMIIHIPTSPSICTERQKMRDRKGECNIAYDYLVALDRRTLAMVDDFKAEGGKTFIVNAFRDHLGEGEINQNVYSFMEELGKVIASK